MTTTAGSLQATSDIVWKISSSERWLFIGVMLLFLIFSWYFMYQGNESQKEQRNAFLISMEKRDDKTIESINRVTDALNRNTEVMLEVKNRIK